ncbi:hypothetical protein DL96DRAFT_1627414 [Flagelloscypha sp. PMI_526]|nr:hypothetical protein DL96DRAFT_1627414 [Flagelloscypha sp. PMI_526]
MTLTGILPDVPEELILTILEYALSSSPSKADIPLLLVSKNIYSCLLPRFCHTLESGPQDPHSFGIDRTLLLTEARPTSLLLVRYLKFGFWQSVQSGKLFQPFSNLSHLALWGAQGVRRPDALGIPSLALEELIIWSPLERKNLFQSTSADSPLSSTLKRFGSYDIWTDEDFEGVEVFSHLTHILVYCDSYCREFPEAPLRTFMERDGFMCWLVVPGFRSANEEQFAITQRIFRPHNDPRIVLVRVIPEHIHETGATPHFWLDQASLWNAAENQVAINTSYTSITVVEELL